jgi:hypothetical protein
MSQCTRILELMQVVLNIEKVLCVTNDDCIFRRDKTSLDVQHESRHDAFNA